MLLISSLHIYPIKSLGGISVTKAAVTTRGLQHDRRWMLVDEASRAITQRDFPQMALLQVQLLEKGLSVHHKHNPVPALFIPYQLPQNTGTIIVQIWDDACEAQPAAKEINDWFSQALRINCRLVYMPDTTKRKVDTRFAGNEEITSFSDDFPLLLIGQASLDELNSRLTEPVPMNRFRPNIVFTGGRPFEEDSLAKFNINGIEFFGVKPCARCVITTMNQDDTTKSREPLKTLADYRMKNNKIYFGQNLLHKGGGVISVGDAMEQVLVKQALI